MGNTPLPGAAAILKWLFIIFNAIFALFGMALIAVGAWLLATGSGLTFIFSNGFIGGAALVIICGGITFILAAIGVVGAICQNRFILVVFAICLTIIVILEIVGAILGFVFSDLVVSQLSSTTLSNAIQEYLTDKALMTLIDQTQTYFKCCGATNYTEWVGSGFYVKYNSTFPLSCCEGTGICNAAATILYDKGCVGAATSFITDNIGYAIALGAVGLVVGLLEIAGIVLSLALCICIHKSKLTEV